MIGATGPAEATGPIEAIEVTATGAEGGEDLAHPTIATDLAATMATSMPTRLAEATAIASAKTATPPGTVEDRTTEDRTAEDRIAEDRIAEDRIAEDRIAEDRTARGNGIAIEVRVELGERMMTEAVAEIEAIAI